jgi:hypothetical protein
MGIVLAGCESRDLAKSIFPARGIQGERSTRSEGTSVVKSLFRGIKIDTIQKLSRKY